MNYIMIFIAKLAFIYQARLVLISIEEMRCTCYSM